MVCIFTKVNDNYKLGVSTKLEGTLYYMTQSNTENGVVWRM